MKQARPISDHQCIVLCSRCGCTYTPFKHDAYRKLEKHGRHLCLMCELEARDRVLRLIRKDREEAKGQTIVNPAASWTDAHPYLKQYAKSNDSEPRTLLGLPAWNWALLAWAVGFIAWKFWEGGI
jgi:hypothetical protein